MPRVRTEPVDLSTQAGRLVWARASAGYPSARVAARINRWPESTYKSHETGTRGTRGFTPDDIVKYAEAYEVNVEWLFRGIGRPRLNETPEPDYPPPISAQVRKRYAPT